MRKIDLYQLVGVCFFIFSSLYCKGQVIYNGGSGAGFSGSCYSQTDNVLLNLYSGGSGKGFNFNCYSQADNVLFNFYSGGVAAGSAVNCYSQADNVLLANYYGGSGAGFSVNCYTQADNVLLANYYGGSGAGFSVNCYTQADNVLLANYFGGSGKGFNVSCYSQADNVLLSNYYGGPGRGFATNCVGSSGGEVPLPVEFLLFNAIPNPDNILLNWVTASENNSDYFQIEKSRDGITFYSIGNVKGAGNSSTTLEYSSYDEDPLQGRSYYRLKEVDFNADYSYSNLVAVNYSADLNFTIYPNPAVQGDFYVAFSKKQQASTVKLAITNSVGQLIIRRDFAVDKNGVIHIQQQKDLPPGIYNVNIWCNDFSNAQMLVVK